MTTLLLQESGERNKNVDCVDTVNRLSSIHSSIWTLDLVQTTQPQVVDINLMFHHRANKTIKSSSSNSSCSVSACCFLLSQLSPTQLCSLLSGLMYEEEGALIELMICAIKQAAQATPPVGRTQGKKVMTHTDTNTKCSVVLWFMQQWSSGARGNISLCFYTTTHLSKQNSI